MSHALWTGWVGWRRRLWWWSDTVVTLQADELRKILNAVAEDQVPDVAGHSIISAAREWIDTEVERPEDARRSLHDTMQLDQSAHHREPSTSSIDTVLADAPRRLSTEAAQILEQIEDERRRVAGLVTARHEEKARSMGSSPVRPHPEMSGLRAMLASPTASADAPAPVEVATAAAAKVPGLSQGFSKCQFVATGTNTSVHLGVLAGNVVALKEYRYESDTPKLRKVLEQIKVKVAFESSALETIAHPAICTSHGFEYYTEGDEVRAVLAVDYCSGGSLEDHWRRFGRPSADKVNKICEVLIDGLTALHGAHIAARNISLDRVLLTGTGEPVLAYYGAAARLARIVEGGPDSGPRCLEKATKKDTEKDREALALLLVQLAAGRDAWSDAGHLPGLSEPVVDFINTILNAEYYGSLERTPTWNRVLVGTPTAHETAPPAITPRPSTASEPGSRETSASTKAESR